MKRREGDRAYVVEPSAPSSEPNGGAMYPDLTVHFYSFCHRLSAAAFASDKMDREGPEHPISQKTASSCYRCCVLLSKATATKDKQRALEPQWRAVLSATGCSGTLGPFLLRWHIAVGFPVSHASKGF